MGDSRGSKLTADSYPPQRHMLRDLLISMQFHGKRRCSGRAPVVPEICTDRGGVQVGVVATLVDVLGGALAIRAVYPDWIATADLSIFTTRRASSGSVNASGAVIRAGRTTVVIEVDIIEEPGGSAQASTRIGSAIMTFSRLPRRRDTSRLDDDSKAAVTFATGGSGLSRSYLDEVGIRILDDAAGAVELNMSDYVRNSIRVLQGGVVALLTDVAGQHAGRVAMGEPVVTRDLTIHYLSQGKIGPFRTRAKVVRTTSNTALTRVEVIDRGANNRLLAVGMNAAALDDTVT